MRGIYKRRALAPCDLDKRPVFIPGNNLKVVEMVILFFLPLHVDTLECLVEHHPCARTVMGAFTILKAIRFGCGLRPLETVMKQAYKNSTGR